MRKFVKTHFLERAVIIRPQLVFSGNAEIDSLKTKGTPTPQLKLNS